MEFKTKGLRRGALAAAALATAGGATLGLIATPAGASNTQVTAVGSFTTFNLMQALFPSSVNNINPNPLTGAQTESVANDTLNCQGGLTFSTAKQPPNGSGQGKTFLVGEEAAPAAGAANLQGCVDFGRSSSPPAPTNENLGLSGVHEGGDPAGSHFDYYAYALDGVTALVGSNAGGTTTSPVGISLAQLQAIYTCTTVVSAGGVAAGTAVPGGITWQQAGIGSNTSVIQRFWPQAGSGTRAVYTDILGFDPTATGTAPNNCTTPPVTGFGATNPQTPNEENTEDGLVFDKPNTGGTTANDIYIYSAGKFTQQWNDPADFNATAANLVAQGTGAASVNIGNFDPTLTLIAVTDASANHRAHAFVTFSPQQTGRGKFFLSSATINEGNEWYSHLPAGDTGNPSDSTSLVPGVRYVFNEADTVTPGYDAAKGLVGFDNQQGGTSSSLCHGDDAATITANGFLPLNTGATAPTGSDLAGATCREFVGLNYPGQTTGTHYQTPPAGQ